MSANFPSHLGLTDIGKVPMVSKLVDQLIAENIISEKQKRDLTTLISNQEKWRILLKIVEKEKSISKFQNVLLRTEYKDIVAVAKIPDSHGQKQKESRARERRMTGENTVDEHKLAAGATADDSIARLEKAMMDGFKQMNENFNRLRADVEILMNQNSEKDDEYQKQVKLNKELEEKLDKANEKLQDIEAIKRELQELKKKYEELRREHATLQEKIEQEEKYKTRVIDWKKEKDDLNKILTEKGKLIENLKSGVKKLTILLK
uniref:Reticulocyte-binding protein 2 homolog a-like n=1 Tax=Crassostrea virginica TaxID=6565 RepID=A0A8B8B429_CRAVI|nr:reticulocyte-binding protein 2 homolog a-like [Crassostrea virginica]